MLIYKGCRTCSTKHLYGVHITILIINSINRLKGGHTHACRHTRTHVHTHALAHTHIHTHTHTHTYTNITDKNKFSRRVALGAGGMPYN